MSTNKVLINYCQQAYFLNTLSKWNISYKTPLIALVQAQVSLLSFKKTFLAKHIIIIIIIIIITIVINIIMNSLGTVYLYSHHMQLLHSQQAYRYIVWCQTSNNMSTCLKWHKTITLATGHTAVLKNSQKSCLNTWQHATQAAIDELSV